MHILMIMHRLADASPYSFFVHEQAKALVDRGHTVDVISPVEIPPMMERRRPVWAQIVHGTPESAQLDGVSISYPRCLSLGNRGERLLGGRMYARAAMPIARRLHADHPFDLVHAHMIDRDGHAGQILARTLGVPLALTAHGTDVLRYFKTGEQPWPRNVETVRGADALMAVSPMLLSYLRPYRPQDKISQVIYNGIRLTEIPKDIHKVPGRILTVGSLKPRKCMDRTLEAFGRIAGEFPEATLQIIGVGEEESALRSQIVRLGLTGRAELTTGMPHREVLREMAASDIFVLPSWDEGFGIVYIEAMACGCITIGSRNEGIDGIIRDGENGFLVPAGSTDDVEQILRRALRDSSAMQEIRRRGRESVQELTWERNARETEDVYRRVLAGNGQGG